MLRETTKARAFDLILESSYLDINFINNFGGSNDVLREAIFENGQLVSGMKVRAGSIQSAIEKYVESMGE